MVERDNRQPTVFVVDDQEEVRESLSCLFQSAGLRTFSFSSVEDFLSSFDRQAPGCLVTEEVFPRMSGTELQESLKKERNDLPIVFLTAHGSVPHAVRCSKNGAVDYLEKPYDPDVILRVVHRAIEQNLRARARRQRLEEVNTRLALLSCRQRQVLDLVLEGEANKVIAMSLGISMKTVEIHRAKMMETMKADSIAELVSMMVNTDRLRNASHLPYPSE